MDKSKNLYQILELQPSASYNEIVKSYRRLALLYHPDKCDDPDATEKFKEINIAYHILSDQDKRREYDELNNINKDEIYKMFMSSLNNSKDIAFDIIKYFYMSPDDLQDENIKEKIKSRLKQITLLDVLDNIKKIFFKVKDEPPKEPIIQNTSESEYENTDEYAENDKEKNNIKCEIKTNLKEMYYKKLKKITIMQKRNMISQPKDFIIPILDSQIILYGEGDQDENVMGDLIILIKRKKDKEFKIINENDLLTIKNISLYELIYGFKMYINLFDEEIIEIKCNNPLHELIRNENNFYYIIKTKGLPKNYETDERGDLIIQINLINTNMKPILLQYFPPVNLDPSIS